MIERKVDEHGFTMLYEGDYWVWPSEGNRNPDTVMYHKCSGGSERDILLEEEMIARKCNFCSPIKCPDDLWTLYVLLDGRGVHNVE